MTYNVKPHERICAVAGAFKDFDLFEDGMTRYYSLNRTGKESERDAGITNINTMSITTTNRLVTFKFK